MTTAAPPAGLRERKKSRTRQAIVRHAVAMFERDGFDATTVEGIAEAVECSERTVYRYFPAKEDIVFFDLPELLEHLTGLLAEADRTGDPLDTVIEALRACSRTQTGADPELTRARIGLWFTDPTLRARYLELFEPWERVIAEFLARRTTGLPADEDQDAQVTAAALLVAMRVAYRNEVLRGGAFDDYLDRAFGLLTAGLRSGVRR